jgi:glycosyltransferase involved in cell wall biosynthesis
MLVGEGAGWSIDHDLAELDGIAKRLGVRLADPRFLTISRDQAVFFGSQFTLLREPWRTFRHSLGTAYFHGRPGTSGMPEFDRAFEMLRAHRDELDRIQVTHAEMHELVLSTGIDPGKVFRIPIGVDASLYAPQTAASRAEAREVLRLPADAFVVGSFQKDGVGWDVGSEPKLIKGPDVLLEAMRLLRERRPELHVLLSGPARGYVRAGLERLGIPYVHRRLARYDEIPQLYAALDAYVVPSRQ